MVAVCRIIMCLTLALLLHGCRTPARPVGEGILYPKSPEFMLKSRLDPKQLSIDTDKVYVRRVEYRNEDIIDYNYLRFWPDGRCFWGTGAYTDLDRDAVESLRIGEPGYFIIEGDEIMMENFSPEYSGSYALSRGKLIKSEDNAIKIRILETRYIGGFSLSLVRRYRYPHFGSQTLMFSDFYPVDFGPLRAMPTWGGDLDISHSKTNAVESGNSK